MRRELRRWLAVTAVGLSAVAVMACSDDGADDRLADRQAEIADRGAEVMPFDLDATTHRFAPSDTGLVETVVATDPSDTAQVDLIRDHLAHEAGRFARGDYGDPATIHGQGMPGLAELEAGADAVAITYENLTDGAKVVFTTDDPDLVDALHRWGEAQTTDHGTHADHGS
ncbi:MAG TPA: hypothetical protein VGO78_18710 [Acidimicrobiales bacterium]|nr:hypothetical protein [Acidimicrobiales bacterium]